jgi:hypothetical protein
LPRAAAGTHGGAALRNTWAFVAGILPDLADVLACRLHQITAIERNNHRDGAKLATDIFADVLSCLSNGASGVLLAASASRECNHQSDNSYGESQDGP